MEIQAFGYLGIGTAKAEDWTGFATGWLGTQQADRGGGMRAFRMDDRKQRLFIDAALAEGERVFGWEVADAAALDTLAGHPRPCRPRERRGYPGQARARRVGLSAGWYHTADGTSWTWPRSFRQRTPSAP